MGNNVFYSIGLPAILYGHLILSDAETLSYYTSTEIKCEGYIGITVKMTNNLLILCYSITLRTVFAVLTNSVARRQKKTSRCCLFQCANRIWCDFSTIKDILPWSYRYIHVTFIVSALRFPHIPTDCQIP